MACTEAVETVIGQHYNSQLRDLISLQQTRDPSLDAEALDQLTRVIAEFRDQELEHLDIAVENEASGAVAYPVLSMLVQNGCRLAIKIAEKIWGNESRNG